MDGNVAAHRRERFAALVFFKATKTRRLARGERGAGAGEAPA